MTESSPASRSRPIHLRWRPIGLVAAGGMIGTGLREALSLAGPPIDGIPLTTAVINIVGAFVLGWLLEALSRNGPDTGRRRAWRLFAGTGVLGGFTTYSALAVDTMLLLDDRPMMGLAYAVGTLVLGALAGLAGMTVGARTRVAR